MSQTYFFPESGYIPGVPGIFAGVRVDVSDDGEVTTTPLERHPAYSAEIAVSTVQAQPEQPAQPEQEQTQQPASTVEPIVASDVVVSAVPVEVVAVQSSTESEA